MLREQCSSYSPKLDYDLPEDFLQMVWESERAASLTFVAFDRLLSYYLWATFLSFFVISFYSDFYKYVIHLDFWATALWWITTEFWMRSCVYKIYWCRVENERSDCLPWFLQLKWAVINMVYPAIIVGSFAFWTDVNPRVSHPLFLLLNYTTPLAVIITLILFAFPLRFIHFYFFIIFYSVYILFTYIYQLSGGTGMEDSVPIYDSMDWREPIDAGICAFLGLIFGLIVHCIFCFICCLKMWLRDRYLYC